MDRRAWSNLQVGQMPKKGSLKKSRATKRRTFKLGVFPLPTLLQIANPMEKCHYICCGPACGIPKNRLLWQKPKRHHSGRHKGSSTWYPRYPFVRGFFLIRSNGIMSLSWFKLTYNCSHDHIIVCMYIYIYIYTSRLFQVKYKTLREPVDCPHSSGWRITKKESKRRSSHSHGWKGLKIMLGSH